MFALPQLSASYPDMIGTEIDVDSDTASDVTLDDSQSSYLVGAPLTRMVKFDYLSSPSIQSSDGDEYEELEEASEYFVRDEQINYIEEDFSLLQLPLFGGDGEGPEGDPLLRTTSLAYARSVVDHMVAERTDSLVPQLSLNAAPFHPSHPLLVRRLPSTSTFARELGVWRYLNSPAIRRDPWNPSPPALSIIERELATSSADRLAHIVEYGTDTEDIDEEAYVVMDPLRNVQENPFKSAGDWIDFARQMLQGLVFLHEHNITQATYSFLGDRVLSPIMMDIGLAPSQTPFSRSDFPVKYYLLDLTKAFRLRVAAPLVSTRPSQTPSFRGRTRKTVMLSASRPRVPSLRPTSYISSLFVTDPSVGLTFNLSRCRARSDSDVTLVSSSSSTPPDSNLDVDTPKQRQFFSRPSSPDGLSDPEGDSEDETSDNEEDEGVRSVSPATRASLFAADLRNLAEMLQRVVEPATPVSEALAPVLGAMRQVKVFSLSADGALRMFENAVRPLDVAHVIV